MRLQCFALARHGFGWQKPERYVVAAWWFSSTLMSLYMMASGLSVLICGNGPHAHNAQACGERPSSPAHARTDTQALPLTDTIDDSAMV